MENSPSKLEKKGRKKICPSTPKTQCYDEIPKVLLQLPPEARSSYLLNLVEKVLSSSDQKFDLLKSIELSLRCNPSEVLPYEICLHIFSFLKKKDLSKAAQVSKQWNQMTKDKHLTKLLEDGFVYCGVCSAPIGKEADVVCRKYRLDYALAYNFKALVNVRLGDEETLNLPQSKAICRKLFCLECKSELGMQCIFEQAQEQGDERLGELCMSECGAPMIKEKYLVKRSMLQFPTEPTQYVSLGCAKCKKPLAKEKDRISWNYRLRGNQAFQFTKVENVRLGPFTDVDYMTGKYVVCEVFCNECNSSLGIKYVEAPDSQNAYKIGTYLIEKPRLKILDYIEAKPSIETAKPTTPKSRGAFSSLMSLFRFRK